jgi:hypothetical protein
MDNPTDSNSFKQMDSIEGYMDEDVASIEIPLLEKV